MVAPVVMPAPSDPTAVVGRRVGAALIDGAIVLGPGLAIASSQFEYQDVADTSFADGTDYCDAYTEEVGGFCMNLGDTVYFAEDGGGIADLVLLGLALAMYVILQGLTGWTVGKRLVGIRCVKADGTPPGIGRAAARWVLWLIDMLPCLGLVGFITSLTTVGHRRVGDMAASTYVVRADTAGRPVGIPLSAAVPPSPGPPGTTPWPTQPGAAPVAAPPQFPAPTAKPGPQWDEARGTYIQWDPEQQAWVQWDDTAKAWGPIS
jgi:uncharacterized RDD family membrane protein YckC